MSRMVKVKGKKQGNLIDDIALGFTTILGITGAAAGVFIPGAVIPVAAIQAGAYCPAIVAAIVKRSANDRRFSEKINDQINSCAEMTAKEFLEELKTGRPAMYSLFRDIWGKEGIYDKNSTLGSIEQNMKAFLVTETRWEGYEITSKDINDVVDTYVRRFFLNARYYPELNQSILFGVSQKTDELEVRQDILEDKMDGLSNSKKKDIRAFYEYIYGEFTKIPKSDLYGKISLKDGYIEPMIKVDGKTQSVRDCLESWVESDSTITVIGGEPGNGKTSLCWKAMYDYYKNSWLKDKVDNVFCFSLNPAKTDALNNDSFNLYKLLSWGNNRTNKEHLLDESDCKNALIFFDGFDELLEWHPGFDMKRFIEDEIVPFQEETSSHVIITTRNMAIEPGIMAYRLMDSTNVKVNRLLPTTKDQQIRWIEGYIKYYCKTSTDKATDLEEFLKRYKTVPIDDDFGKILGIPIIFRMLVEARYLPKKGDRSIPRIYDELFHITWIRHNRRSGAENELNTKKRLQKLALKIFIDKYDTVEIGGGSISPWLFSFYTAHEGKKRAGFLHRSFYQYFLAHEILSWYSDYADNRKDGYFREHLKYFASRRLDDTTIEFIKEIYDRINVKDGFSVAFKKAYTILKETDGILAFPSDEADRYMIRSVKPIVRANNVFWNIFSLGSVCGQVISLGNISIEALRTYDLSECRLTNAILEGAYIMGVALSRADLRGVNFRKANLSGADLREADLDGVDFSGADLSGANLSWADLSRVDLREARLRGANLVEADLSGADLSGANLVGADLSEADLSGAGLSRADLRKADFDGTDFSGADLSGANLSWADLSRADLREARFRGANLSGVNLRKADLNRVDFSGANLSWADFSEADLSGANLGGVDFSWADLRKADLTGADFTNMNLHEVNLERAIVDDLRLYYTRMEKRTAGQLKSLGCDISQVIITD